MIHIQNIIDDDKNLFTVLLTRDVLNYLKCKSDDRIVIMQSKFNPSYFLLAKAKNGYRLRRYPKLNKVYQINIEYKFNYLPEFELKPCSYFVKDNSTIRIIVK